MIFNPWKITKDFINNGKLNNGTSHDWEDTIECNDHANIEFRLLDDDKNIYFKGVMKLHYFHPLDELGKAYGCTELQYLENGEWKAL